MKVMPDEHKLENVPMPPAPRASGPRSDLGDLLSKMKKGQSFLTRMNRGTVYSLSRYYGIRVSVRAEGDDGQLRVWRIK